MRIIEKIEIKNFRSFDGGVGKIKVEAVDLRDLNIFSGANDSGKSNVLRALNLFFNNEIAPGVPFDFERDLSKIKKERSDNLVKTKRESGNIAARQKDLWIKIKVHFKKEEGGFLPESFFIEKMWDKNGLSRKRKHNIKKDENAIKNIEGQVTQFLNKIIFEYVPAVKDRQFFNHLFKKLQNYLLENEDKKPNNNFKNHSSELNRTLKNETRSLFDEFKRNVGVSAEFRIPETLVDFFRTLSVETEGGISLFDRGDGIQARFIPDILNEISKDTRKKVIWGFEEPENSYEPLRCFQLAQDFIKYAQQKQIFITSHAFPFIALKGDKISSYRVKNEGNSSEIGKINWEQRTIKGIGFKNDTDKLEEEMGVLETYSKLSDHLREKIKKRKNWVFVEDSKKQIYKIAWLKLNDKNFTIENFEKVFGEECPFHIFSKGGRQNLQKYLDMVKVEELENKIIGIFDFDDAFIHDFKGLGKDRWGAMQGDKASCFFKKRNDHNCFFAIMLPVPAFRNDYADADFLSNHLILEHLFEDSTLKKVGAYDGYTTPAAHLKVTKLGGKGNLWEKILNLPKEDFGNFKPLFDKINELLSLK